MGELDGEIMAKCDCCGCVFLSDYGTSTITGEGTATDPYVVSVVDPTWERPSARVRRTTTQSIPSTDATFTPITFNTAIFDTRTFWSAGAPTLITIPEQGLYVFGGNGKWAANATGTREIGFRRNGSEILLVVDQPMEATNGGTTVPSSHASYQARLNAGDTLELIVRQESGGALDMTAEADNSIVFWIVYAGKVV